MIYKTSVQGKIFLASLEGLAQTKYKDSVGVWTIGVGATASEIPDLAKWPMDKQLSIQECFDLLNTSLLKYENAVNKTLRVAITQPQFDALVSICYNIGTGGLSNSTFMERINQGLPMGLIRQAIMMWKKPPEIVGRRTKEANLFATGDYPADIRISVFPVSTNGAPLYRKAKIINGKDYIS